MNNAKKFIFLVIFFTVIMVIDAPAQGMSGGENSRINDDFKFLPIPYINYNRSLGFQYGALPMIQFNLSRTDTLSPSSMAGLFGMYTTNKSSFFMAISKLYFDEDNWRVALGAASGSINFQFYIDFPIEMWIPYNSKMKMIFIQPSRKIFGKVYLGISYVYLKFDTSLEISDKVNTTSLNGLGINLSADYRSNIYYPKNGYLTNLKLFSYPGFMGNDAESNKIELSYKHFLSNRNGQDVIAFRGMIGIGLGKLDFNQQFIIGRGDDIRGYTQGEYRGDNIFTLQGEYRFNIKNSNIGFVGFAGLATVSKALNKDHNWKILPGIGAGFRYTVSQETNINVGLDFAKGNGDWGIYFRIGESFSR